MLAFVASFADQLVSSMDVMLGTFAPELAVLGVFFISCGLWKHLGSLEERKRAARKLKADEADTCTGPKKPHSTHRFKISTEPVTRLGDAIPQRDVADARAKALEAQILHHLEQREFTRALNLYRNAKPDSCEHNFSEQFYTAFIESAVRVGKTDVVERLFNALRRSTLRPSDDFWQKVLKMLSSRKHFTTCLLVHSAFGGHLPHDKVVWSCLANAALEVGEAEKAASMLDLYSTMDISNKDRVLFFRVFLALKDVSSAEAMFRKLGADTSSLMLNLLLLTCVKAGQPDHALQLLHDAHVLEQEGRNVETESLSTPILVDTISYNTVIKGLAQASMLPSCFKCLREMITRGLQPDDITFATLLDACIEENAMGVIGEIVNISLEVKHQVGPVMYTLFIKGLVKANCLPKALELYQEMQRKAGTRPDRVTYSILIKALVDQHDLEKALQLVGDMKSAGLAPDDIILTHLLDGCRYDANLELGKKLFNEMVSTGLKPSEFTLVTMLKLCGRVGAHQDAHDLVENWEARYGHKPSVIHYTCLMSGCLRRKHYDLAWAAFELMQASGVRPDSTTFSTLLPGMVASQHWDRVLELAKEALALPVQNKIPHETLNSALVQMQGAKGYARHAVEFRELMQAADIPVASRRRSHAGHPQPGHAQPGLHRRDTMY